MHRTGPPGRPLDVRGGGPRTPSISRPGGRRRVDLPPQLARSAARACPCQAIAMGALIFAELPESLSTSTRRKRHGDREQLGRFGTAYGDTTSKGELVALVIPLFCALATRVRPLPGRSRVRCENSATPATAAIGPPPL